MRNKKTHATWKRKKSKRRSVSMRPLVFQRLIDLAGHLEQPLAATVEQAIDALAERHGVPVPARAAFLDDKERNRQAVAAERERRLVQQTKGVFTW